MSSLEDDNKPEINDPNPDDIFKILIATDCHLGYSSNKKKGDSAVNDSFTTFEEILQYGIKYDVDFVILGGDLFHDSRPTQNVVFRCINLLKKYCLGNKEHKIEFLTDPNIAFHSTENKMVNFENPNLNIKLPIFSIHGNHDNPNFETIGSMDVLSSTGLINYFGKYTDVTKIDIPPIILKKGASYIALYGLNFINDERLSRLFREGKVKFLRSTGFENCFNMFVLHQNRVKRADNKYIQESTLPDFIDFIIWGHEHECKIEPELSFTTNFYICQPGSPVATSLCKAETVPKHVGILEVSGKCFKFEKIPLKTVRPFVMDDLYLREQNVCKNQRGWQEQLFRCIDQHIETQLIPKAAKLLTGHPNQPVIPLIRLRVFYNDSEEVFDEVRLVQKYCDEVQNPTEMILFVKEKNMIKTELSDDDDLDEHTHRFHMDATNELTDVFDFRNTRTRDWKNVVLQYTKEFFESEENKGKLQAFTVNGLNEALNRFIVKTDTDAIYDIVQYQRKKALEYVKKQNINSEADILEALQTYLEETEAGEEEELKDIRQMLGDKARTSKRRQEDEDIYIEDDILDEDEDVREINTNNKGTRGRGRGKGSRGRGGRGRGSKTDSNKTPTKF